MSEDPAEYNAKPKKGIDSTPEVSLRELALMVNFTQNALVELLIPCGEASH